MSSPIGRSVNTQHSAISELTAQNLYNAAKEYAQQNNWPQAVPLYTQAADLGFSKAQNRLGMCYAQGNGVELDVKEAADWFQRSVDQDNRAAQYNLAGLFRRGIGVAQDDQLATQLYQRAADQNLALAQCRLGNQYEHREPIDLDKAARLYKLAADQGLSFAQYSLGRCYQMGKGVSLSPIQASRLFLQVIEQDPSHQAAQRNLEECHTSIDQTMDSLRIKASEGDPKAQFELGFCYKTVLNIFPFFFLKNQLISASRKHNSYIVIANGFYCSKLSVEVSFFCIRIVFYKHNLSTFF